MLSRKYLLAGALCVSTCALAVTPSIGSLTARGETKIDHQDVKGSGTVFDGSVIETGQSISSGADLRLANKLEITLSRDSLGTLYRDHFMLQRGTAQLGSTNSFRIQASGVVVVPTGTRSSGIVSIDPANSVTVEAKNGTLEIRNSSGASIALVHPGHPLKFSPLTGKSPAEFSAAGTVSSENGRYYLSSADTGMKYEVKGDNLKNYDGSSVIASGILDSAAAGTNGVSGLILANNIASSNSGGLTLPGLSNSSRALVGGLAISTGATALTTNKCPPSPTVDCCPGVQEPQCCNPLPGNECGPSH